MQVNYINLHLSLYKSALCGMVAKVGITTMLLIDNCISDAEILHDLSIADHIPVSMLLISYLIKQLIKPLSNYKRSKCNCHSDDLHSEKVFGAWIVFLSVSD